MEYTDQLESDYDDDTSSDISCEITTVIWGQNILYSVDRHTNRQGTEYNICVSINDSYDAEELGQGFEGQALDSLRRGVAIGVTRWILNIPLSNGVYHIFMYNDGSHAKGFTKIAKRLGFSRDLVNKYSFTVVIKDGEACRWRTRWAIIKKGLAYCSISELRFRLEIAYCKKIRKMRKKR